MIPVSRAASAKSHGRRHLVRLAGNQLCRRGIPHIGPLPVGSLDNHPIYRRSDARSRRKFKETQTCRRLYVIGLCYFLSTITPLGRTVTLPSPTSARDAMTGRPSCMASITACVRLNRNTKRAPLASSTRSTRNSPGSLASGTSTPNEENIMGRLLAMPSRPRRAPTYTVRPSPYALPTIAGRPSIPVHGSSLNEAITVACSPTDVMTSAKSCAVVPLSRSRYSGIPGQSSPNGANSSTLTPTTSRIDPG